jgi:hypothetical protein
VVVPPEPTKRTLDERLFVRFPSLLRALAAIWSGLPPKSRLRRAWTARLGCRGCAAGNRRDYELLVTFISHDIEYHPESAGELGRLPDLREVQRGHDGYIGVWETVVDAWPDVRLEFEEMIDFGDRMLAVGRLSGHGGATGIPMDEPLFQVFTLRRGLAVRQRDFGDLEAALEAAASQ